MAASTRRLLGVEPLNSRLVMTGGVQQALAVESAAHAASEVTNAANASANETDWLAGDANQDGTVNEVDLDVLRENWLANDADWSRGDFTGDGVVAADDLNLLAKNWLTSQAPLQASEAFDVHDIDRDGIVSDADVQIIIDYLDGKEVEPDVLERLDVNQDGSVSPLDALLVHNNRPAWAPIPLPGDANGDGTVDEQDLNVLHENWLASDADWSRGDLTGDGLVNADDLNLLAKNWLTSTAPLPPPQSFDVHDIDQDGTVGEADVQIILDYLDGNEVADEFLERLDVNQDGIVSPLDALDVVNRL